MKVVPTRIAQCANVVAWSWLVVTVFVIATVIVGVTAVVTVIMNCDCGCDSYCDCGSDSPVTVAVIVILN